jgi:hypothetical protein
MVGPDQSTGKAEAPTTPPAVKVIGDIPVLYADAVSSQAYVRNTSKFFLVRFDPNPHGVGTPEISVVQQIVMPMEGFVQMWVFFEHRLKMMIRDGTISKDIIEHYREQARALPGASSESL